MADTAPFTGFGKQAMDFLKALGFHQDREWFHENKKLYDAELRGPLCSFVADASARMEKESIPLFGTQKSSLFRINRDIRFSKEKHPYNTHVSGVLTRNGTKKDMGGVYFHFSPEGSFFASGLWHPPSPELKAMREQIVARKKDFLAVESDLAKKKLSFGADDMLKRLPPQFKAEDDPDLVRLLKHKSYVVSRPIDNKRITSPKLLDDIAVFAKDIEPFMQFVWRATDPVREQASD